MTGAVPSIQIYVRRTPALRHWVRFSVGILLTLLIGYWCAGKSFGYLGYYPVLISEISLTLLGLAALGGGRFEWATPPSAKTALLLTVAVLAQGVYCIFVLRQNAVEVGRGVAPYYYSAFAFLTFNALRSAPPHWLKRLFGNKAVVRLACIVILASVSAAFFFNTYLPSGLPRVAGTDLLILYYKASDVMLPLTVMLVLWSEDRLNSLLGTWALGLCLIASARSRAAMVGVFLLFLMSARMRPRFLALAAVLLSIILVMVGTDTKISLGYREVSVRQYAVNLIGLISPEEGAQIDYNAYQNREWRRRWWMAILNDSITEPYLLLGRGWGSNLALDYGVVTKYDVRSNEAVLRNPHNIFFSTLGRGGWLVATLWLSFYLALMFELVPILRAAKGRYPQFFLVSKICLAFLAVALVQGGADVFLESPQNAIPHWIVVGIAWFVIESWRNPRNSESSADRALKLEESLLKSEAITASRGYFRTTSELIEGPLAKDEEHNGKSAADRDATMG